MVLKWLLKFMEKKKRPEKKTVLKEVKFNLHKDKDDIMDKEYPLKTSYTATKLPLQVYLRDYCPDVKNQGRIGSCGAHAYISAYETLMNMHYPDWSMEGSELFHYYFARYLLGWLPKDSGITLREGARALKNYGFCPEVLWPYDTSKYNDEPGLFPKSFARYIFKKKFPIKEYNRMWSPDDMQQALAQGIPVILGVKIYSNFLNHTNGVYDRTSGSSLGGHAMCCLPDTIIYTDNGIKKIQDICVEDKVLTHNNNYKSVEEIMERDTEETIYEIYSPSHPTPLKVTGEHPILINKSKDKHSKFTQMLNHNSVLLNLKWENAKNIKKGNFIYTPIDDTEIEENWMNKDFFRLLGIYIGDGNCSIKYSNNGNIKSGRLRFCINREEDMLAEDIEHILKGLGCKSSRYYSKIDKSMHIISYDTKLTKKILGLCGGTKNKHISQKIMMAPKELQKEFLIGWHVTDGCTVGDNVSIFTSEKNLAEQFSIICNRLRLFYSVQNRKKGFCKIRDTIYKTKGGYNFLICGVDETFKQKISRKRSHYYNNYLITKISKIKKVKYSGKVYNFEVDDDNSYVANGITVHNCIVGYCGIKKAFLVLNSWGRSWGITNDSHYKGYCWMSYDCVRRNLIDAWTIQI